jgi:hypothetical protein
MTSNERIGSSLTNEAKYPAPIPPAKHKPMRKMIKNNKRRFPITLYDI